ncbi:MAG: hypothetical protein K6T80_04890 [Firmicutes bacterium]|nr:hypothetical protein [Bacillota bacterium]
MKVRYICECCGETVNEAEVPFPRSGGLTGEDGGSIIGLKIGGEPLEIEVLCADCWEIMYGDGRPGFYSGPVLH